ncbi:PilN domain-containing protein, partial [Sandarakinorhabdus sp.]|uniref:PilN domain-containing protein n=1 Tax=Sandarakinorhabdus sp. TaxID=1916663 RepID=UPI00286D6B86
MTAPAILDADMATVARWLRSGFAWWTEELRLMAAALPGAGSGSRALVLAHFDGEGFLYSRRGAAIARANGPVAIVLPASAALVRQLRLPALGPSDLRRLLAMDSDRLLPFSPGAALIAHEAGVAGSDGQQPVDVAGLPVSAAEAAMAAALAEGLDVRALKLAEGDGARFDFLPGWDRAGAASGNRERRFWWTAVALAVAINLAALVGREVIALNDMTALVEAHGQTAATARLLRARVISEDTARRALLERRAAQDPLALLSAIAQALPDTVWVQRLAWDGRQLRISGYKPGNVDVAGLLRKSPLFTEVRSVA